MSFVDGNTWYCKSQQPSFSKITIAHTYPSGISEWRVNWTSALFYNGNGDLYFAAENNASNGMYWQIYELPGERFQFRARNSNTRRQLAVCHDPEEISSSLTQPCMEPSSADESQQWTIEPWGDGESYKIQNVANGTGLNLDWVSGGWDCDEGILCRALLTAVLASRRTGFPVAGHSDRAHSTCTALDLLEYRQRARRPLLNFHTTSKFFLAKTSSFRDTDADHLARAAPRMLSCASSYSALTHLPFSSQPPQHLKPRRPLLPTKPPAPHSLPAHRTQVLEHKRRAQVVVVVAEDYRRAPPQALESVLR
jgi:hypothetical protein